MPLTPSGSEIQQIPDSGVVDNAAITQMNTSAALEDLRQAYRQGLVTSEQLTQLFTPAKLQQSNEEIQSSKARTSLLPAQTALAQNKIAADNALIQPRMQAELGDINSKIELQPGNLQIAKAGQSGAIPEAEFSAGEMKTDPTGSLTETRKNFQALHLGGLMRTSTGEPDYEGMAAANNRLAMLRTGSIILPTQQAALDELKKRSPEDYAKAFNTDGSIKTAPELAQILANSKPAMNPAETQSASSAVIGADTGLKNIQQARGILAKDPGSVGPGFKQGSAPGQAIAKYGAMFGVGNSTERFDNQKRLNTVLSQGILESIRSLRGTGAIRNTEIEQIEKGQPQPDSSISQWTNWLQQSQDLLERAQRAQKLALPTNVNQAIQPQSNSITNRLQNGETIQQPTAGANAAAGLPKVMSQSDYDALKPGERYTFNGEVRVKAAQ